MISLGRLGGLPGPYGPAPPYPTGSWSHTPFDLVFLVLLPALVGVRLHPPLPGAHPIEPGHAQRLRGHLQPLGLDVLGGAVHRADRLRHPHRRPRPLPGACPRSWPRGEFAAKIQFLDVELGYLLLGFGFFLATMAIILVGQGAGQRLSGARSDCSSCLGSLATYGVVIVYMGVGGGQIIAAIAASVAIVAASLWILPPSEITHDPIGAFMVPGLWLAGLTLIIWTVVVGGSPPGHRLVGYNRACFRAGRAARSGVRVGLRSTTGNRVGGGNSSRGFESLPLRLALIRGSLVQAGFRTREGASVSEPSLWTVEQRAVRAEPETRRGRRLRSKRGESLPLADPRIPPTPPVIPLLYTPRDRARWGASGALYPQSASAGLNPHPRSGPVRSDAGVWC